MELAHCWLFVISGAEQARVLTGRGPVMSKDFLRSITFWNLEVSLIFWHWPKYIILLLLWLTLTMLLIDTLTKPW